MANTKENKITLNDFFSVGGVILEPGEHIIGDDEDFEHLKKQVVLVDKKKKAEAEKREKEDRQIAEVLGKQASNAGISQSDLQTMINAAVDSRTRDLQQKVQTLEDALEGDENEDADSTEDADAKDEKKDGETDKPGGTKINLKK